MNFSFPPLQHVFDDLSGTVSLSWVGDSTGVSNILRLNSAQQEEDVDMGVKH